MAFDPVEIAKKYNGELVGGCVTAVIGGKKEFLIERKSDVYLPTDLLLALESGVAPKKGKKKAEPKAADVDVEAALNDE